MDLIRRHDSLVQTGAIANQSQLHAHGLAKSLTVKLQFRRSFPYDDIAHLSCERIDHGDVPACRSYCLRISRRRYAGAMTEDLRIRNGIAIEAITAVNTAGIFASCIQAAQICGAVLIDIDAAHKIMCFWCND